MGEISAVQKRHVTVLHAKSRISVAKSDYACRKSGRMNRHKLCICLGTLNGEFIMKFKNLLAASAAVMATSTAFVTLPTPAVAQQTTSDILGTVTDAGGAPIAGASVTVTDTRTGARRTATTSGNGGFSARNLTVGGPYSVSVSASGYGSGTH